jgi:hypothetical protein
MFRIAIIVLVASAYFSPAYALRVDPWNDPEHTVLDLQNRDRAGPEPGLSTADGRLHAADRAPSRDLANTDFAGQTGRNGNGARDRTATATDSDFETYWTLIVAAGDKAPQEFPLPPRFAAAHVDPVVTALAAVPLPSSFWLLLTALVTGLSLIRRRVDKT